MNLQAIERVKNLYVYEVLGRNLPDQRLLHPVVQRDRHVTRQEHPGGLSPSLMGDLCHTLQLSFISTTTF
jgi:hypothetical protein